MKKVWPIDLTFETSKAANFRFCYVVNAQTNVSECCNWLCNWHSFFIYFLNYLALIIRFNHISILKLTVTHEIMCSILKRSMQSRTLHIVFSLFSIFHKASFMRKYVDRILLPIEEALWKMENNKGAMFKVPLCMLLFTNFSCKLFRLIYRYLVYLGYITCENAFF